jgi:hypothetical protein
MAQLRETITVDVDQQIEWPIANKAMDAIFDMLARMRFQARHDGGLEWLIELDGHAYTMDIDRDGNVRSICSSTEDADEDE